MSQLGILIERANDLWNQMETEGRPKELANLRYLLDQTVRRIHNYGNNPGCSPYIMRVRFITHNDMSTNGGRQRWETNLAGFQHIHDPLLESYIKFICKRKGLELYVITDKILITLNHITSLE